MKLPQIQQYTLVSLAFVNTRHDRMVTSVVYIQPTKTCTCISLATHSNRHCRQTLPLSRYIPHLRDGLDPKRNKHADTRQCSIEPSLQAGTEGHTHFRGK